MVVEIPKSDAGFGMIIGPDGAVSQFNGTNGAAERAGVPLGSKVTAVNGVAVSERADIVTELGKAPAGTNVSFTLAEATEDSQVAAAASPAPEQPPRPARPARPARSPRRSSPRSSASALT